MALVYWIIYNSIYLVPLFFEGGGLILYLDNPQFINVSGYINRLSAITKSIQNKAGYLRTIHLKFESEFDAAKADPLDSSIREKAVCTKKRLTLNLQELEEMLDHRDKCLTQACTAFPYIDFEKSTRDRISTTTSISVSRTCARHPNYDL